MPNESDEMRRAREAYEQAQRELKSAVERGSVIYPLARDLEERGRQNHFSELFTRAFGERRRRT